MGNRVHSWGIISILSALSSLSLPVQVQAQTHALACDANSPLPKTTADNLQPMKGFPDPNLKSCAYDVPNTKIPPNITGVQQFIENTPIPLDGQNHSCVNHNVVDPLPNNSIGRAQLSWEVAMCRVFNERHIAPGREEQNGIATQAAKYALNAASFFNDTEKENALSEKVLANASHWIGGGHCPFGVSVEYAPSSLSTADPLQSSSDQTGNISSTATLVENDPKKAQLLANAKKIELEQFIQKQSGMGNIFCGAVTTQTNMLVEPRSLDREVLLALPKTTEASGSATLTDSDIQQIKENVEKAKADIQKKLSCGMKFAGWTIKSSASKLRFHDGVGDAMWDMTQLEQARAEEFKNKILRYNPDPTAHSFNITFPGFDGGNDALAQVRIETNSPRGDGPCPYEKIGNGRVDYKQNYLKENGPQRKALREFQSVTAVAEFEGTDHCAEAAKKISDAAQGHIVDVHANFCMQPIYYCTGASPEHPLDVARSGQ
jgi:hypothetical protein